MSWKQDKTKNHPISAISVLPLEVYDTNNGEPVDVDDFLMRVKEVLLQCRPLVQQLIDANIDTLPYRSDDNFGSKWARDNISIPNGFKIPDDWIQPYYTTVVLQHQAASIIVQTQNKKKMFDVLVEEGTDISDDTLKKKTGLKYLKRNWINNVRKSIDNQLKKGKTPVFPKSICKAVKFDYANTDRTFAQIMVFDDIIWCHAMIVGSQRYDVIFPAKDIWRQYGANMEKVCRPIARLSSDDKVSFDFAVMECVEKPSDYSNHVVAFDRNMDYTIAKGAKAITGVRVSSNGQVSYPLGMSVESERIINNIRKLTTERSRLYDKRSRLMPYQIDKRSKLTEQIAGITASIKRKKKALDQHLVDDMLNHVKDGDFVAVEYLKHMGGGPVKFRHGSTDEKLDHAAERRSVAVRKVNPRNTSACCGHCGDYLVEEDNRDATCPTCAAEVDHDDNSPVNIGFRSLIDVHHPFAGDVVTTKSGGVRSRRAGEVRAVCPGTHDSRDLAERSERKRCKRVAKMMCRAERGQRVYRVKDKATPSRPCRKSGSRRGGVVGVIGASGRGFCSSLSVCMSSEELISELERFSKPWTKTNSFVDGAGTVTCHAYFVRLREERERRKLKKTRKSQK